MKLRTQMFLILCVAGILSVPLGSWAALREEHFDRQPANWVGINNRNTNFPAREVKQDFGWSPKTSHAGGKAGEIGGKVNPAGEPAYYAYRLPDKLDLDSGMVAEGNLFVSPGPGHFMLGFFNTNANSIKEWRTPNSFFVRINSRGQGSHFHLEYCTAKWRAGAGVIGEIVQGEKINAKEIPNGKVYHWTFRYAPRAKEGKGVLTFTIAGQTATCEIEPDHRRDGLTITHFGLMPIIKTWDSPGEIWLDDVTINGRRFDFSEDPQWESLNNRKTYMSSDTRPRFDFGWSPTQHARGMGKGELGGLIFRGDCREASRRASYGDKIGNLTMNQTLEAKGKITMLRGITDATASIGFYNSEKSMQVNPSQKNSIPMSFLGVNIEGPSSDGFYFYPIYRVAGDESGVPDVRKCPRIYPDGKPHNWSLWYNPEGANGRGSIRVALDDQSYTYDLPEKHNEIGAVFDRFGICTTWIDGNSVTAYFDDLSYTVAD